MRLILSWHCWVLFASICVLCICCSCSKHCGMFSGALLMGEKHLSPQSLVTADPLRYIDTGINGLFCKRWHQPASLSQAIHPVGCVSVLPAVINSSNCVYCACKAHVCCVWLCKVCQGWWMCSADLRDVHCKQPVLGVSMPATATALSALPGKVVRLCPNVSQSNLSLPVS